MMRAILIAFGVSLVAASTLFAQQGTHSSTALSDRQALLAALQAFADSLSAPPDYVREVFYYPRFGRLNPVEPPATVTGGAAFPDISLSGIIYDDDDPLRSMAIVRVRDPSSAQGFSRRVVKVGDTIDQYRIAVIEPNRVLADVYFYGGVRRIELKRSVNLETTPRANRHAGSSTTLGVDRSNDAYGASASTASVSPKTSGPANTPAAATTIGNRRSTSSF